MSCIYSGLCDGMLRTPGNRQVVFEARFLHIYMYNIDLAYVYLLSYAHGSNVGIPYAYMVNIEMIMISLLRLVSYKDI